MRKSEIYRMARERLRGRWTQHAFGSVGGRVCAMGAIRWCGAFTMSQDGVLPYGTHDREEHMKVQADFRSRALALHGISVESFNDFIDTEEHDVLSLFDHVISEVSQEEAMAEARAIVENCPAGVLDRGELAMV